MCSPCFTAHLSKTGCNYYDRRHENGLPWQYSRGAGSGDSGEPCWWPSIRKSLKGVGKLNAVRYRDPWSIPTVEVVAKVPEKKGTTKHTNVHDDGLSPSVRKAFATGHGGKAFVSSPCLCASVAMFLHGKKHEGKENIFFLSFWFKWNFSASERIFYSRSKKNNQHSKNLLFLMIDSVLPCVLRK